MPSVGARKALVDAVLARHGVDLQSRVYFSHDEVMQDRVIPDLDISDERDIEGMSRYVFPFVSMSSDSNAVVQCLDPHTVVEWHCHTDADIYHIVCSGYVMVTTLKRDEDGVIITDDDGNPVREEKKVGACEWWFAPRGEPYGFRTEDEPSCKTYFHDQDPTRDDVPCRDSSAIPRD